MRKSMMKLATMTMALIVGVAAAAPPALANCYCPRPYHCHVAMAYVHPHRTHHSWWANDGWGPGVGFEAMTGIYLDHPATYNHPYYYGGGPYGNCQNKRAVVDARGNFLGWQAVYTC
jgi:hypothetical protein